MYACLTPISKRLLLSSQMKYHPARTHGLSRTPTYSSWMSMKQRCLNPKERNFHNYGGRGIKICKRWKNSFAAFFKDMGLRPKGLSLGRKNNNGNYSPSNCRWETPRQQCNNTRRNIFIEYQGRSMTVPQWAREFKIHPQTLFGRLSLRWPLPEAFLLKPSPAPRFRPDVLAKRGKPVI